MTGTRKGTTALVGGLLLVGAALFVWLRAPDRPAGNAQPEEQPAPGSDASAPSATDGSSVAAVPERASAEFSTEQIRGVARRHVYATVVTVFGEPVEGALVSVTVQKRQVGQKRTTTDGTCAVEVPAFAAGRLIVSASLAESDSGGVLALMEEKITLVLRPVHTFRFRVVDDETDEPIEGCMIGALHPDRWRTHILNRVQVKTGSDGSCSLKAPVPVGRFEVSHPRYRSRQISETPGITDEDSVLVIRLAPRPLLRVRVVDDQGQPIREPFFGRLGYPWRFEPTAHETKVVLGQVEHLVPAAELHEILQVRANGFAVGQLVPDPTKEVQEVVLEPGAALVGRIVGLVDPGAVSLSLFTSAGRPRDVRALYGYAAEDGRFQIDGLRRQSSYQVTFASPETSTVVLGLRVEAGQEVVDWQAVDLRKQPSRELLTVRVIDPEGKTLSGARISFAHLASDAWFSDASGLAEVPNARAGSRLRIDHPEFLRAEVVVNDPRAIEVMLQPGPLLRGLVVDDRGAPIPFAMVRLLAEEDVESNGPNDPVPRTWCDASGRFELHQARRGASYVHGEAPGFVPAWPYPLAAEGGDIVLRLSRNTWLVVELIAEHVTGEWSVETTFPWTRRRPIPRHERLVWMPVRPGKCTFSVELPGQPPIKQSIEIFPGETKRVRVEE